MWISALTCFVTAVVILPYVYMHVHMINFACDYTCDMHVTYFIGGE